jgi:ankyrin repeat protein
VRQVLEELPKSLDGTYERIVKGINKAHWEYAYRLLRCLTVAVRPLRVEELAEVLAVDLNPGEIPKLNTDWRWEDQEEAVLSACSSLVAVIVDNGSRVVQFSHFSVKEFLTSDRLAPFKFHISLEPAHATLAQACLCVLLRLDDRANEDSKTIPLVRYAAEFWVKHAQFANEELGITDTMDHFLDMDKPHFSAWVRIQGLNDLLRRSKSEQPRTVPPPAAPLYFAAESGFRGLVERMIVKHPTHLNTWGGVYGTPLHASVLGGHIGVAQFLVTRVADVDARSADDWTPLHFAANNGHLEISRILFEHRAEVNTRDHDGRTPLHYASWKGHLDVVRLLLDRGADARIRDNSGYSPLYFAMTSRQLDVARILLLKHEAEANARDDRGRTFLHCASAQGHDDVVRFFLELHADVDARDNGGNTPLHLAASNGNLEVVRILLDHEAQVDARNDEGSTPLHKASDGEPDVVELLLDRNAEMYAFNHSGETPLHIAAATGSIEVARILFEHVRKHLPE